MRYVFLYRAMAAARAGVEPLLRRVHRPDGQPGLDEWLVDIIGETDRERRLAFCHRLRQLTLVAADDHILGDELSEIFFPLHGPEEAPRGIARAGNAGIEDRNFPLPLGPQEIVIRRYLFRPHNIGIPPHRLGNVGLKHIDMPPRFVRPYMASPPLFRVPDLRQEHQRSDRIQKSFGQKAGNDRVGAADMDVEVVNARFLFRNDLFYVARTAPRYQLQIDVRKALSKHRFRLSSQLGAGRNRDNHLDLFLSPLQDLFPIGRPIALAGLRPRGLRLEPQSDCDQQNASGKASHHSPPRIMNWELFRLTRQRQRSITAPRSDRLCAKFLRNPATASDKPPAPRRPARRARWEGRRWWLRSADGIRICRREKPPFPPDKGAG